MIISLKAASSGIINAYSDELRTEAIELFFARASVFMKSNISDPAALTRTTGMPIETFRGLLSICEIHRDKNPDMAQDLLIVLTDVVMLSADLFKEKSPFLHMAAQTALVNKLLGYNVTGNAEHALRLIEKSLLINGDSLLSTRQKQAAYSVINASAPNLIPDHYKELEKILPNPNNLQKFLPPGTINQDLVIEILHKIGKDPLYLAELCLNRHRNMPPARSTTTTKYQLMEHFVRAGEWHDGPQTCVGVSAINEDDEFFLTPDGILFTIGRDPAKISGQKGKSIISSQQLTDHIKAAQELMRPPAPGT